MEKIKVLKSEKKSLKLKLREIQLVGLKSYRSYLDKEFENSKDKEIKEAYHKYIAKEIKDNIARVSKIEKKIAKKSADNSESEK